MQACILLIACMHIILLMYIFLHTDTSIKNYYDGQVRLQNSMQYDSNHEQSDAHLLEIYLDQDWRPVCVNSGDVNKVFADSTCRQMGYTSAESFRPSSSKYAFCCVFVCFA